MIGFRTFVDTTRLKMLAKMRVAACDNMIAIGASTDSRYSHLWLRCRKTNHEGDRFDFIAITGEHYSFKVIPIPMSVFVDKIHAYRRGDEQYQT